MQNAKQEVRELEQLVKNIKHGVFDFNSIQGMVRTTKDKISNRRMIDLLSALNLEIENLKKEQYLQLLSGVPIQSESDSQVIDGILLQIEKQVAALKKDVRTTETYYRTDKKTKIQLFIIYIGLALALSISYFYGNEILMNHPELQKML